MLRNIHFFNIKSGIDKKRILHLIDHEIADYAKTFGCIERKTWKLLDAYSQGKPIQSAEYMNEGLWPSQKEADAFGQAARTEPPDEIKKVLDEVYSGTEFGKSVRYVDDE